MMQKKKRKLGKLYYKVFKEKQDEKTRKTSWKTFKSRLCMPKREDVSYVKETPNYHVLWIRERRTTIAVLYIPSDRRPPRPEVKRETNRKTRNTKPNPFYQANPTSLPHHLSQSPTLGTRGLGNNYPNILISRTAAW